MLAFVFGGKNPVIIQLRGPWHFAALATRIATGVAVIGASMVLSEPAESVQYGSPSIGLFQECGMLRSGRFSGGERFNQEWIDHFGAYFTQSTTVGERLDIAVGLGGIFEFQKPEIPSPGWGGTQYKNFFVGPSTATVSYKLGDVANPWLKFGMGMFPFKYNGNVQNLGEYLFRANPYPNYIMTGGYSIINNSGAYLQGANAEFKFGNLTLNLLMLTETSMPPLYDWSVASIAKYVGGDGMFELGAGINFKRLIPVRTSRTSPLRTTNAYFKKHGQWYTGTTEQYEGKRDFDKSQFGMDLEDAITKLKSSDPAGAEPFLSSFQSSTKKSDLDSARTRLTSAGDPAKIIPILDKNRPRMEAAANYQVIVDSVKFWTMTDSVVDPSTGSKTIYAKPDYQYYSAAGTIVMGRFSLDPKKLISWNGFGPEDLKLYGEAALLGWKDYPVFYEKKSERMPLMLGFNLPAFNWLDVFSVECEYYKSPFLNSTAKVAGGLPLPFVPNGQAAGYSSKEYNDGAGKNDFSWSILLKKEVIPGVTLSSQLARDHLRMVSVNTWFGPGLETEENLETAKDWYWMLQIGIGI